MEIFSPHEAASQLRSPPCIERLVQLLVWPLKLSSCDLSSSLAAALEPNKVLIQSVIFTLMCQEAGDELRCVCVMFVVSRIGSGTKRRRHMPKHMQRKKQFHPLDNTLVAIRKHSATKRAQRLLKALQIQNNAQNTEKGDTKK